MNLFNRNVRKRGARRAFARLMVESLEDRLLLASLGTAIADGSGYPNRAATKIWSHWSGTDTWFQASGSLIDSYHVLTAGHVIYESDPTTPETGFADKVIALPGYSGYNGQDFDNMVPYGLAKSAHLTVPSDYTTNDSAKYDFGLITLDRPMGDITGWLGWEQQDEAFFDSKPTLNIMHYPADSTDGRTLYQGSGTVDSADGDTFSYTYEHFKLTEGGSSGAGIYRYDAATGDRRVVGVVSRGDDVGDTNPYLDEVYGPALADWLDDEPKPASMADVVDYDWFFDRDSGLSTYKPWMRTNNPLHSGVGSLNPNAGSSFSATATIYNTGTALASGTKVSFYLSTNTTISTSDTLLGSRFVDVGATNWAQTTWSGFLPSDVTGTYYVGWMIDPDNTLAEYGYGGSEANLGYYPNAVNIHAVPDHLDFNGEPSPIGTAGATINSLSVYVLDASGSRVTDNSSTVRIALNSTNGATLSGTTTVTAVNGIATFNNLSISKTGSYSFVATSTSLAGSFSNDFAIRPAAVDHLAFRTQPTNANAGVAFAPTVEVVLQDRFNNLADNASASVILALGNARGASLLGTTSVTTFAGVAKFNDVHVNTVNTGYTLFASSGRIRGATSQVFAIANHAPVLDTTKKPTLLNIAEDNRTAYGTPLGYLSPGISDSDSGAQRGIAITGTAGLAKGTWQYTLNGGTSWLALGAPSLSAARLLPINANQTRIRFVPNANFNGSVFLAYTAWDLTQGAVNGTFDLSQNTSRGGSNAFSFGGRTANLTVTPLNDAPVLDPSVKPSLSSIPKGTVGSYGTPITNLTSGTSDVDVNAVKGIAITAASNTANGIWQYTLDNGSSWKKLPAVSATAALLLPANGVNSRIRFVPNANFSGSVSITYFAWDRTQGVAGGTWDISLASQRGGTKAFSIASRGATLTVTP